MGQEKGKTKLKERMSTDITRRQKIKKTRGAKDEDGVKPMKQRQEEKPFALESPAQPPRGFLGGSQK